MGNQTARRQVSDQQFSVDDAPSHGAGQPSASAASERTFIWEFLRIPTLFLAWALFDLKVYGRRHVPRRGGVLIVSNHQSNLDPVLMGVKLQRPLNYIANSELFHRRFGRWLLC